MIKKVLNEFTNSKEYNWMLSMYLICTTFLLIVYISLLFINSLNEYFMNIYVGIPLVCLVGVIVISTIATYRITLKFTREKLMKLNIDTNIKISLPNNRFEQTVQALGSQKNQTLANTLFVHLTAVMVTIMAFLIILMVHSFLFLLITRFPYVFIIILGFLLYKHLKNKEDTVVSPSK